MKPALVDAIGILILFALASLPLAWVPTVSAVQTANICSSPERTVIVTSVNSLPIVITGTADDAL
jgi:hypothetical protein